MARKKAASAKSRRWAVNRQEFIERLARTEHWRGRTIILIDAMEELMESVAGIQAALSQLVEDTSKALTDIAAKIAALEGQVITPEVAAQIVGDITALDANIKAADPGAPA